MHRLSDPAAAPAAPIVTPVPADVPAALAGVCKALGLPDNATADTIRAALEACFTAVAGTAPEEIAKAARYAGLSEREATMLSTTPGFTLAKIPEYLAARRATRAAR